MGSNVVKQIVKVVNYFANVVKLKANVVKNEANVVKQASYSLANRRLCPTKNA